MRVLVSAVVVVSVLLCSVSSEAEDRHPMPTSLGAFKVKSDEEQLRQACKRSNNEWVYSANGCNITNHGSLPLGLRSAAATAKVVALFSRESSKYPGKGIAASFVVPDPETKAVVANDVLDWAHEQWGKPTTRVKEGDGPGPRPTEEARWSWRFKGGSVFVAVTKEDSVLLVFNIDPPPPPSQRQR